MTDLERAREVRDAVANGTPPDGWPVLYNTDDPVPKCTMITCPEPGIYKISAHLLTAITSTNGYACEGHLDHFGRAAIEWVRDA